jgi:NADH:ubiquinone oxidoreductase subunit E
MTNAELTVDLALIRAIVEKTGKGRDACVLILQAMQTAYGYLPPEAIRYVVEHTDIGASQLFGVATFYEQFRFAPIGKHLIRVCHGTACHVNGANRIDQAVEEFLGIADGETTEDGLFTLQTVACLGCCSLSPVMMIGETVYGRLTPKETGAILKRYQAQAAAGNGDRA